jgi:hypothetical protein
MQVSGPDAAVLLLAGVVVWASWNIDRKFACAVAFVVGHFFLFCNVVRSARRYELIWAAFFTVNMLAATSFAGWSWTTGMLAQLPVTASVLIAEKFRRRKTVSTLSGQAALPGRRSG